MPQMMPLMWLILFIFLAQILFNILILIYFNQFLIYFLSKKQMKIYWSWKW